MSLVDNLDKETIRQKFLSKRRGLSKLFVKGRSNLIAQKLLGQNVILGKNRISAYLAINNEVDTNELIDKLIEKGSTILIPAYFEQDCQYHLTQFENWRDLEQGPQGIWQPSNAKPIDPKNLEVSILPGIAFSKKGVRLGYGKGIFDKLLYRSKALKIGLAYDFQIIDEVPQEKHDLVMDVVVTEERVIFHSS